MKTSRLFLVAAMAGLLSTAALATPPSADAVSVDQSRAMSHDHAKIKSLFDSPEEFMMFRLQIHDATKGMGRDQRKAYRRQELSKVKAMNDAEKASWRRDLQTQWNALPEGRRARIAQRMDNKTARHQQNRGGQGDADQGPGPSDDMGPAPQH